MYGLEDKVALVTGASNKRGLGCGIALRLAREGCDVIVTGRQKTLEDMDPWDREDGWCGLESVVSEIQALGRRAVAITADLTSSSEVNAMAEKALQAFGHVDILVNNAGVTKRYIGGATPLIDLSEEAWNMSMAVNLTGVFLLCKAIARPMIERGQGGKIINISSIGGKRARAGRSAYQSSKAGLNALTGTLALELAPHKINVNAICPANVVTWANYGQAIREGMRQGLSEEQAIIKAYNDSGVVKKIPLGRPCKVEDVANVVAFLASSQSDYMTGQAINVTGGMLTER